MSELDRDAATLLRAGRSAFRPGASDRERVLASLSAALGESAQPHGAHQHGPAHAAVASHTALKTWLIGGLGAVALGTGVAVTRPLWTQAPSHPSVAPTAAAELSPSDPKEAVQEVAPASPPSRDVHPTLERSRPTGSRGGVHPPADFLAEEVRLLSNAAQQMNEGAPQEALKTLAEHERKFPAGSLAEERMAARAQALCALGRTAEAESELTRLTRTYPKSPHLERARRVCGNDTGGRAPAP